jgi:hydrogenase/urease accessory protein HupE
MRRILTAVAAFAPTAALAHEGHHETLTFAEQVRHLLTEPDHILAFAALVVLAVVGTWSWRRAKARK